MKNSGYKLFLWKADFYFGTDIDLYVSGEPYNSLEIKDVGLVLICLSYLRDSIIRDYLLAVRESRFFLMDSPLIFFSISSWILSINYIN